MNVYKKLQTCRKELKALPVKESGNNKFAGYTYMELGDFLPHITDLCEAHGLCPVVSFKADCATLTIINSDKPEEHIIFESPMSTAELKGCHAIQNLGAVETYLRRYLYVNAFDIVEHDALDSTQGKTDGHASPERYEKGKQGAKSGAQGANAAKEVVEPTTARLDLLNELGQIFHGNAEEMADALRNYSVFKGKEDKDVFLTLKQIETPTDNVKMHKWFAAALKKLREDSARAKESQHYGGDQGENEALYPEP